MNLFPAESELFVASAAAQSPECYADIVERGITGEFFSDHPAASVFKTVHELHEKNEDVNIHSIVRQSSMEPVQVAAVYKQAAGLAQLGWHIEQVINGYHLRKLRGVCSDVLSRVENIDEPDKFIDEIEHEILQVRGNRFDESKNRKQVLTEVIDDFERALNNGFEPEGISTGFPSLDKQINGLEAGKLYIIAARPSMGKTSLLRNIVEHVSVNAGLPSLFISAEMSNKELWKTFIMGRAGVSLSELVETGAKPTKGQLIAIQKATQTFMDAPISIEDKSGPTIGYVRAKARRLKRKGKLGLIAVDYLQLMRGSGKSFSRENEINMISQGLKALSKDMECPVVCLAQLNRGPENRTGESYGVPRMSDLRESGAIEQDADVVSMLYRPGYYDKENEAIRHQAKLLIEKNRSGCVGPLELEWEGSTMRFREPAIQYK